MNTGPGTTEPAWTETTPTEPGYYWVCVPWWVDERGYTPLCVEVFIDGMGWPAVRFPVHDDREDIADAAGWWWPVRVEPPPGRPQP